MNKRFLRVTQLDILSNNSINRGTAFEIFNKNEDQVNGYDIYLTNTDYYLFNKSNRLMRRTSKRVKMIVDEMLLKRIFGSSKG